MPATLHITLPAPTPITLELQEARDAYQLAVAGGFAGTREEWLESHGGGLAPGTYADPDIIIDGGLL